MSDNPYILLGLDPTVDDWKVIEAALRDKRRSWSLQKNQGAPDARRNAARLMRRLPDMETELRNPQRRRAIAREAEEELEQERRRGLAELDRLIGMILKSTVDEGTVKWLVRKVAGGISESDVVKRLGEKGVGVGRGESTKGNRKSRPKLDPTDARGVQDRLRYIGVGNLYEFLEKEPQASPKELLDAAAAMHRKLHRSGRTDAETTARIELTGYCNSVFKKPAGKVRYDNTLAAEGMREFDSRLEFAGRDGLLERGEVDRVLSEAHRKSISRDIALEYIEEYAQRRKWEVQRPSESQRTADVGEAASGSKPFRFLGRDYYTKEDLAKGFADNWDEASDLYKRRKQELIDWLKHDLGEIECANDLERAVKVKGLSRDTRLIEAIAILSNPTAPISFRGIRLTETGVAALADKAQSDAEAGRVLCALHENNIMSRLRARPNGAQLCAIDHAWQTEVRAYEDLRRAVDHPIPELKDKTLTRLLAAATPGSRATGDLRDRARKAVNPDVRACPWFRALFDLGQDDLGRDDASTLLAMLFLAPHAETETVRQRQEEQRQQERERKEASHGKLHRVVSALIGALVGTLAGLIVGLLVSQDAHWFSEMMSGRLGVSDWFGSLSSWIFLSGIVVVIGGSLKVGFSDGALDGLVLCLVGVLFLFALLFVFLFPAYLFLPQYVPQSGLVKSGLYVFSCGGLYGAIGSLLGYMYARYFNRYENRRKGRRNPLYFAFGVVVFVVVVGVGWIWLEL